MTPPCADESDWVSNARVHKIPLRRASSSTFPSEQCFTEYRSGTGTRGGNCEISCATVSTSPVEIRCQAGPS